MSSRKELLNETNPNRLMQIVHLTESALVEQNSYAAM